MTTLAIDGIQAAPATIKVNRADLPDILDVRKGANFVTFVAVVKAHLNKTAKAECSTCNGTKIQPGVAKVIKCRSCKGRGTETIKHTWGEVSKISLVNGQINWYYESAVQRRQVKHDVQPADFKSAGRAWGVRLRGTPFVTHKSKQYVEVRVLKTIDDPRYFAADGTEIPADQVKPFLPKRKEGERQQRAGVPADDVVICRDYGLTDLPDGWGIRKLSINGEVYDVED
jgi:hypothetical protein